MHAAAVVVVVVAVDIVAEVESQHGIATMMLTMMPPPPEHRHDTIAYHPPLRLPASWQKKQPSSTTLRAGQERNSIAALCHSPLLQTRDRQSSRIAPLVMVAYYPSEDFVGDGLFLLALAS